MTNENTKATDLETQAQSQQKHLAEQAQASPLEGEQSASGSEPENSAGGEEKGEPLVIEWREPDGFLWLSIKNFLLSVMTLGIYYFWGKTEVRRRIWRAIHVNGEPLEYTGTGWELFKGFLIVGIPLFVGFFLYSFFAVMVTGGQEALMDLMAIPLYLLVAWLMGLAIYRTWRYRLRRTRWRGIRGTLAGAPVTYANAYFITTLLMGLTLGWLMPWRARELHTIMTNDTRIGTSPLRLEPEPALRPLYKAFAPAWFMGVFFYGVTVLVFMTIADIARAKEGLPTSGLSLFPSTIPTPVLLLSLLPLLLLVIWMWLRYSTRVSNWFAAHTRLHNGRFRLDLKPKDLFFLRLGNFFIALLSLGILLPFVQKRMARFIVTRLSFEGTVDLAKLTQATDSLEHSGEGLGEFFDIDAF